MKGLDGSGMPCPMEKLLHNAPKRAVSGPENDKNKVGDGQCNVQAEQNLRFRMIKGPEIVRQDADERSRIRNGEYKSQPPDEVANFTDGRRICQANNAALSINSPALNGSLWLNPASQAAKNPK